MDSVERLQGLHADLVAFTEQRLANIDRLVEELQQTVLAFRNLLDKSTPSSGDREKYNSGSLEIDGQEYGVNDEFRHISRAIGTTLDLDEVEAGRLLIQNHDGPISNTQSFVTDTVSGFHNRRDLLLQALRITLHQSLNQELPEPHRDALGEIVAQVLDIQQGIQGNGSLYTRKCIDTLAEIERFQARISDALQSKAVLGEPRGTEFYATFEFQRDSLFKQHEALASILAYLFQGNYTSSEDLRRLHNVAKTWDRLDLNMVHYLPAFSSAFQLYGSPESGQIQADQVDSLNTVLGTLPNEPSSTVARPFHAILVLWWTVEYSGRFRETPDDAGAERRSKAIRDALQEDSLEFLLSICTSIHADVWRHPARQELVALLLIDSTGLALEGDQTSSYFGTLLMESLENFVEAFITNMPDSIRRLKTEEDDQRLNQLTAMQHGVPLDHRDANVSRLHLESFLVLASYAFEQRPEAASQWWEDTDNNLYGFLHWASVRQTVPRVSAFCELLCSISEDQECAESTHKFLLNESLPTQARGRKTPSMNYQQIFDVLMLYSNKVHEREKTSQLSNVRKVAAPDMNELETPVMLSCYLRLLAHLCKQPSGTRQYILETNASLTQSLLVLSSGPIPSYLRASIFAMLDALLTDKDIHVASEMWQTLDIWAAHGHDALRVPASQAAAASQAPKPTISRLQTSLSSIALSFDQYDSFVVFLRDLITPMPSTGLGSDLLPFPRDLGTSYRAAGIGPYVDFVCGQILVKRVPELNDDTQRLIALAHCLEFVAVGIEGFNEDYVAMLDRSKAQKDMLEDIPPAIVYAHNSPFARLMQWVLSTDMIKIIMESMLASPEVVEGALPDSPLLLGLRRSIDIVNRVLDLQPTYFDIVKPLVQPYLAQDRNIRSTVACMEDAIVAHPQVVLKLCQFAATSHSELSLRSLALLQKLSSSPKLNNHFMTAELVRGRTRRILDALGPNASFELQPVSVNLSLRLTVDFRELEEGFESVGYLIKDGILAFFNASLETQSELPNIAHLLLGFNRLNERLAISDSLDAGTAVFNSVIEMTLSYPSDDNGELISWLIHLRTLALRVLRHLWSSQLSSTIVIGQLRRLQFLQYQYINQSTISQQTIWDGNSVLQPQFWYTTSAEALADFFAYRASLFNYTVTELRAAADDKLTTSLRHTLSTLQGKTSDADGSTVTHPDVFAFLDFLELDLAASFDLELDHYSNFDPKSFMIDKGESAPSQYDISVAREWLNAVSSNLVLGQTETPSSKQLEDQMLAESDRILARLEAENRWICAHKSRADALYEYVNMIIAIIECCPMDYATKSEFILRMLQIMLPKLDAYIADESKDVVQLARAADVLLFALADAPRANTHADSLMTERLFQLFRASIEGIPFSDSSTALRKTLYSICVQYLNRLMGSSNPTSDVDTRARRNVIDCVRSSSQRLIQVLCDDADDGIDSCRLNALNLLGLLTSLARTERSSFMISSLIKANALEILIDPLKYIATEFQQAEPSHRPYLLSIFEARMLLFLQISRSRDGAGSLLDAGFMSAARESLLFRADPDLGIAIPATSDNDATTYTTVAYSALQTYYLLVSSVLRVLLSIFTCRGAQNEQIQYLARTFLTDYRPNMVSFFKRYAGVNGKVDEKSRILVAECVRCYTGLVTLSGFVDFEDQSGLDPVHDGTFS